MNTKLLKETLEDAKSTYKNLFKNRFGFEPEKYLERAQNIDILLAQLQEPTLEQNKIPSLEEQINEFIIDCKKAKLILNFEKCEIFDNEFYSQSTSDCFIVWQIAKGYL